MTGGFQIRVDQVRSAAGAFGVAGDMLGEAGNRLSEALSAQGACWGGDESGQTFSQDYVPAADGTVTAFGDLTTALQAIKTALDESANSHEGTDQNSGGGFTAMQG